MDSLFNDDQNQLDPIENNGLFSNYYLGKLHDFHKDVRDLDSNTIGELFEKAKALFSKVRPYIEVSNEKQVEHEFIYPMLADVLGHHFDPNFSYAGDVPDFMLFPTEEKLEKAKEIRKSNPKEYIRNAIGVADSKAWHGKGYSRIEVGKVGKVPIQQIHRYLQHFTQRWGFITNGEYWYLFNHSEGIRQDQFLKIDLVKILSDPNPNFASPNHPFRTFLFFFQRQAFERDENSKNRLDRVLEGVRKRTTGIQKNLKGQVYTAFQILAKDIVRMNDIDISTPQSREELKENTMVLLYRVLFLLYAESRDILPVNSGNGRRSRYLPHSLDALQQLLKNDKEPLVYSARYWKHLKELFKLVNGLDKKGKVLPLNDEIPITPYNGGLFNIEHWPKLKEWEIGDKALSDAIRELTVTYGSLNGNNGLFPNEEINIDYQDLSIQHLGNIYEGILENRVVADETGQLQFVTDNSERRASGSYYTPDYIVDYIVKKTIEPLLEKKKKVDDVLGLAILDPAMGSGHFLIGVIDFIAAKVAELSAGDSHYTVEQFQDARRIVAERCIYGVDVNPIAVELARLAIWLHTVSPKKPLTFLDHQIKCGNSLVGASISELGSLPAPNAPRIDIRKKPAGDLLPVESHFSQDVSRWLKNGVLFTKGSDDIETVKLKESLENEQQSQKNLFREVADFWVSRFFLDRDLPLESILSLQLAQKIRDNRVTFSEETKPLLQQSRELAKEKRFFHWDIEFPQVFFDLNGKTKGEDAGFDAIVGNPPYIRQESLGDIKEQFLKYSFKTYSSTADIYVYFYELASKLLKQDRRFGFISSNKFVRANYGKPLRDYLRENSTFENFIDFGELPVFEEAATFPCILIGKKEKSEEQNFQFTQVKSLNFILAKRPLETVEGEFAMTLNSSSLLGEIWSLALPEVNDLVTKVNEQSLSLSSYLDVAFRRGILTGLNEAFIIDKKTKDELEKKDPKSKEILKPLLKGDDIRKYYFDDNEQYLIWTYKGVKIDDYPAVLSYLKQFQKRLEVRQDQGDFWWELRPCDYYDEFAKTKIIYPDIAMTNRFAIDTDGFFVVNTAYIIPVEDYYLLSILNSKLTLFIFRKSATVLGDAAKGGRLRWIYQDVEKLPIKNVVLPKNANLKIEIDFDNVLKTEEIFSYINKLKSEKEVTIAIRLLLERLAKKIVNLNVEKNKNIKSFKKWWHEYELPEFHSLKPISPFTSFWKTEFSVLLRLLRKNSVALDTKREDNLEQRFAKAKTEIIGLDSKILTLEQLVDQLVYRLYGLTTEEVGIIEGEIK